MTLIAGINLSNRLYLAADSRITRSDGVYFDHAIKILPVYGPNILDRKDNPSFRISVAAAGNVAFATHLINGLRSGFADGSLSGDIRILAEQLEQFAREQTDVWLGKMGQEYQDVCLLFAGGSNTRPKKIDLGVLKRLTEIHQRNSITPDQIQQLMETLKTDPIMQQIDRGVKASGGGGVIQSVLEGSQANLPEHLFQAIIKRQSQELDGIPDTLLVSLMIRPRERILSVEKAEWGELLAYGSRNLTRDHLPEDLLATLELSRAFQGDTPTSQNMQAAIIKSTFRDIVAVRNIQTIGGTVVIHDLIDERTPVRFDGNNCVLLDGKLFIKTETGALQEMKPFTSLGEVSSDLTAEMSLSARDD